MKPKNVKYFAFFSLLESIYLIIITTTHLDSKDVHTTVFIPLTFICMQMQAHI